MEEVFEILEVSIMLLMVLALGMNLYVVKRFGQGALNVVFASLGFSVFFLGSYFVFHALAGQIPLYMFVDGTKHIWAHVLVDLSMLSLIWGGYRIKGIVAATEASEMNGFGSRDIRFFSFLGLVMVAIFILTPALEGMLAPSALVAIIDEWGLHHFTVFIFGAVSIWYLRFIQGNWGLLSNSITMLIGFLTLIGLQHFWETVTESWKSFVPSEVVIEGVELMLVVPALILLCVAQWRIIKFIKS